jgi:hypothetical protein
VAFSQTTNMGYASTTKLLVLLFFVRDGKQQVAINQPSQATNHQSQKDTYTF